MGSSNLQPSTFNLQPATNLRSQEPAQRIAKEGVCLIRITVPLSILIADDLNRHHNATRAQAVLFADASVHELVVRTHGEFCSASELAVLQDPDFIVAGMLVHLEITWRAKLRLLVPDHRFDAECSAAEIGRAHV